MTKTVRSHHVKTASRGLTAAEEKHAKDLFETYDYDRSGTISLNELVDLLRDLQFNLPLSQIQVMVEEYGRNSGGENDRGQGEMVEGSMVVAGTSTTGGCLW